METNHFVNMVETIILGLNVTNVISFVTFHKKLGNLSNDDSDRNKNGKKTSRFRLAKEQLCTCITHLLYISLASLHDNNVKEPNFMFRRGREY